MTFNWVNLRLLAYFPQSGTAFGGICCTNHIGVGGLHLKDRRMEEKDGNILSL